MFKLNRKQCLQSNTSFLIDWENCKYILDHDFLNYAAWYTAYFLKKIEGHVFFRQKVNVDSFNLNIKYGEYKLEKIEINVLSNLFLLLLECRS